MRSYDPPVNPPSCGGDPHQLQLAGLRSVIGMCLDRRDFLAGSAAVAAAAVTAMGGGGDASAGTAQPLPLVPVDLAPGLTVLRRASWGADLAAPAGLPAEAPGDVRVLLVHHSASTNDYGQSAAADQIRQFHALHTGPERGWPDVAYNFLVDRFGRVWEGRAGSLDAPVIGDATGGNQGFSQLVCLIGTFVAEEPTPEALDALGARAGLARPEGRGRRDAGRDDDVHVTRIEPVARRGHGRDDHDRRPPGHVADHLPGRRGLRPRARRPAGAGRGARRRHGADDRTAHDGAAHERGDHCTPDDLACASAGRRGGCTSGRRRGR